MQKVVILILGAVFASSCVFDSAVVNSAPIKKPTVIRQYTSISTNKGLMLLPQDDYVYIYQPEEVTKGDILTKPMSYRAATMQSMKGDDRMLVLTTELREMSSYYQGNILILYPAFLSNTVTALTNTVKLFTYRAMAVADNEDLAFFTFSE